MSTGHQLAMLEAPPSARVSDTTVKVSLANQFSH